MTLYSIALFLHIVGALGLFVALGLEWAGLVQLRRAATAEQAREWLGLCASLRRIGPIALVTILLPGFYMTAISWGGTPWIGVALASMVLMAILGAALSGRRFAAIGRAAAAERGGLSDALRDRLHDPILWTSTLVRTAIGLGIVFLMTVKPGLVGALLTIGTSVVLGLAAAAPVWSRGRAKEPAA